MTTKDLTPAVLSLAALIISISTFALSYQATRRAAILGRKPVLVFEYEGDHGWFLRNVGSGPALNIVVAQRRKQRHWFNPVRVPPFSKDGSMLLAWLGHVNTTGLGATYSDSEGVIYTSTCGNDLSEVHDGELFGPWKESEIGRHWNQPPYRE